MRNSSTLSGLGWTVLRPSAFMSNTLDWVPQLRAGDLTRDADLLELAYAEARTRVDAGSLTAAEQEYVKQVWQRQFGLISVG